MEVMGSNPVGTSENVLLVKVTSQLPFTSVVYLQFTHVIFIIYTSCLSHCHQIRAISGSRYNCAVRTLPVRSTLLKYPFCSFLFCFVLFVLLYLGKGFTYFKVKMLSRMGGKGSHGVSLTFDQIVGISALVWQTPSKAKATKTRWLQWESLETSSSLAAWTILSAIHPRKLWSMGKKANLYVCGSCVTCVCHCGNYVHCWQNRPKHWICICMYVNKWNVVKSNYHTRFLSVANCKRGSWNDAAPFKDT